MHALPHTAGNDLGDRILKVNHAGEHGAISIYTGQILMARLTAPHLVGELVEFRSHEQRHRSIFGAELAARAAVPLPQTPESLMNQQVTLPGTLVSRAVKELFA